MKIVASLALIAGIGCSFPALAQGLEYAKVVPSCGTPPYTYQTGATVPTLVDANGNACSTASVSVTVGNVTPAPATPAAGTSSTLTTGGTAVTIVTGAVNGCYIVNPLSLTDQGIAAAEVAYVNPVTTATAAGNGTNTVLQPGQAFNCIPGQTTNISAIAATSGHRLNIVKW